METLLKKDRIKTLSKLVKSLTVREQNALLNALKRKALIENARKLDKSVKKNSVSMEDIMEEVNKSRMKIAVEKN